MLVPAMSDMKKLLLLLLTTMLLHGMVRGQTGTNNNSWVGYALSNICRAHRYLIFNTLHGVLNKCTFYVKFDSSYLWQSQVEYEHYSTVSGLLVISPECFIEITPDFLCPFMSD